MIMNSRSNALKSLMHVVSKHGNGAGEYELYIQPMQKTMAAIKSSSIVQKTTSCFTRRLAI